MRLAPGAWPFADRRGLAAPALLVPALLALLALVASPVLAHVGSPNVFFDGKAGPYPVRVIVRPPAVIPGLAEITVRVLEQAEEVQSVTVQPVQWSSGTAGAPPPDLARPVPGDPGQWSGQLWLMTFSSYSVQVAVRGAAGAGTVVVPVPAVPTRMLGMQPALGWTLAGLGLFLFAGALTLVSSAVRESRLPAGEEPSRERRSRASLVTALAGVFFAVILYGGKVWWQNVEAAKKAELYRPLHVTPTVRAEGGRLVLRLTIDDPKWLDESWSPLMPDHGKLMHLFLIREPGLDAFLHLHPVPLDRERFEVPLPPLFEGSYRIYAEVVHESGFPETLIARVTVPGTPGTVRDGPEEEARAGRDPDDSWRIAVPPQLAETPPASSGTGRPWVRNLGDGLTLAWKRPSGPLKADQEQDMVFELTRAGGAPVAIEPYMGMLSHAVVSRTDGAVFVHLHPMGSISMAAQQLFERQASAPLGDGRPEGGAKAPMPSPPEAPSGAVGHAAMGHAMPGMPGEPATAQTVSFPYAIPRAGVYRLWVQVKVEGEVRTGVFDAEVR